ncbi:hydroxysteroid (20-beta) dehydrogenase 2 isoform X2 [Larimichthys crocea]|uniref:hydroxysteroid (20-beta) dehydrogenase 2 isoform X2 n=1 Tax=Larimichthys crocea TaxID=215358 RepID=UPI000F5F4586|nr:very-long-chain 3-oxoacyl-CoA reductase isoform X2 [Larimichthys crocea]
MSLSAALAIVGGFLVVFHLTRLVWRCWCGLRQFVLSQFWQVDFRKFGQWAVVTGATSGIGKAYAIELARRGLDVVLVSRSDKKLQLVAKEIEDLYGRKTRTIRADFTDGHRIYPAIAEELQGLQIGVLVNNVGMSISDSFTYFLETPDAEQKITHIVNCNVLSVPQMTRLILPDMVQRGTGLIINISSQVAVRPQPLLSVYSANLCDVFLSVSARRVQVRGNYCSVRDALHGFHQHDKKHCGQQLREERSELRPRRLEHRRSLQLHQRLPVPRSPGRGAHTRAGLGSYVVGLHQKTTKPPKTQ